MRLLTLYRSKKGEDGIGTVGYLLIVVVALFVIGSLGYVSIPYIRETVSGITNSGITGTGCSSDNTVPIVCSCGGVNINQNLGKPGVEPEFCCDGKKQFQPCACNTVNSCGDYKTALISVDDQISWCTANTCKVSNGCNWVKGSCIPKTGVIK